MLVIKLLTKLGIGLLLIFLNQCIKENNQNPTLLLIVLGNKPEGIIAWTPSTQKSACLLTAQNVTPKVTYCFNVSPANCGVDFFKNFPSQASIQNRKDDMTFISINYGNCNGATQNLFPTYDSLSPPASMIFKFLGNSNGSLKNSDFSIVHNQSCDTLGLTAINSTKFSRILTEAKLVSLNNLQSEIGMISSSNNSCLLDLSVSQTSIDFLSAIRNNIFQLGYICDNSVTSTRKCPWLKSN